MITNKQIIQKIQKANKIAIFAHVEPDPDACGSMLGMREFCRYFDKNADVFSAHYGEYVANLFPMNEFKSQFVASFYDLVILMDLHVEDRLDKCFVEEFKKCKNVIVIDHHMLDEKEVVPTKNYRILHKASASQLVLDLFKEVGQKPSKQTAEYLYTGLVGDTDRFMFLAGHGEVFDDAKILIECGVDYVGIYNKMFRTISQKEIALTKFLYSNLSYFAGGEVVLAVFSLKDMKKLGVTADDVKMFSNSLLNIKGVKWTLLSYEIKPNVFKFSMRSAPEIDIFPFALKMGGGGHKNASAFINEIKASQIKKTVKGWIGEVMNG